MSNLADHELDRLRCERDALDDANTKLGNQLLDARTERDEAQAEARQYKEQRDDSRDNVTFLSKSIHEMSPQFFEAARLWGALEFYADPATYFAIGFFPDPPCGDFAADTSETHLGMKPGKRARALLLELAQEVSDEDAE